MSSLFVDAVRVSFYANTEALLITAAGAFAVYRKVLAPDDLKVLGATAIKILFPCLAFSFFQDYSPEMLAKWYVAFVCSLLSLILGFALGQLGARVLCLPQPYDRMLVLCTTFGNIGALPYVLVPPIAANWALVANDVEAVDKGRSIIQLYALAWSLTLFSLGKPYALAMRETPLPSEGPVASPAPEASWCRRALARLLALEPAVYCGLVAITLGCIAPLRDVLSPAAGGALRFVGSFSRSIGEAGIPISTIILGASLYNGGVDTLKRRRARAQKKKLASSTSAWISATDAEDVPEATDAAEDGLPKSAPVVAPVEVRVDEVAPPPMTKLLLGAVSIRLVLMPAISIPLLLAAARAGAVAADEPMLIMVLMVQSGVPSAQTALALLAAAGMKKEAGEMAAIYLPMYAISVITLAVVIIVAVVTIDTL